MERPFAKEILTSVEGPGSFRKEVTSNKSISGRIRRLVIGLWNVEKESLLEELLPDSLDARTGRHPHVKTGTLMLKGHPDPRVPLNHLLCRPTFSTSRFVTCVQPLVGITTEVNRRRLEKHRVPSVLVTSLYPRHPFTSPLTATVNLRFSGF